MDPEDFYVDPSTDLTRSGMAIEEWLKEDEKNKLLEPEPEVEAEAPQDGGVSTETQTEQPQEKPKAEQPYYQEKGKNTPQSALLANHEGYERLRLDLPFDPNELNPDHPNYQELYGNAPSFSLYGAWSRTPWGMWGIGPKPKDKMSIYAERKHAFVAGSGTADAGVWGTETRNAIKGAAIDVVDGILTFPETTYRIATYDGKKDRWTSLLDGDFRESLRFNPKKMLGIEDPWVGTSVGNAGRIIGGFSVGGAGSASALTRISKVGQLSKLPVAGKAIASFSKFYTGLNNTGKVMIAEGLYMSTSNYRLDENAFNAVIDVGSAMHPSIGEGMRIVGGDTLAVNDLDHPAVKQFKNVFESMALVHVFGKLLGAAGPRPKKPNLLLEAYVNKPGISPTTDEILRIGSNLGDQADEMARAQLDFEAKQYKAPSIDGEVPKSRFRADKNRPVASSLQGAHVSTNKPGKVYQQLNTLDELPDGFGSTDSVMTARQAEIGAEVSGYAPQFLREQAKQLLGEPYIQGLLADLRRNKLSFEEVFEPAFRRFQEVVGRDAGGVDLEEFWEPILADFREAPFQTGKGISTENFKAWSMENVIAADMVNGALFKQLRDAAMAAREIDGVSDIFATDGVMKSIADRLVFGLTNVKRSRYLISSEFSKLRGRGGVMTKQAAVAAAERTAQLHDETVDGVRLMMQMLRNSDSDELAQGVLEVFSMSNKIRNWKDFDAWMRQKIRGGDFGDSTKQGALMKELGGVMVNSILSGPKTPLRAIMGTTANAYLNEVSGLLGAALRTPFTGDIHSLRASAASTHAMFDLIPDAMKVFRTKLNSYMSGDIATIKNRFSNYTTNDENWSLFKSWTELRGNDGDKAAFYIADTARELNSNSFLTWSSRVMGATDDTFRWLLSKARSRRKALLEVMAEGGDDVKITPEMLKKAEDIQYKKLLDSEGNLDISKDSFLESQLKEVTLTTELKGFSKGLEQLMNSYPLTKPFFLFARTGINGLRMSVKNLPLVGTLLEESRAILNTTPKMLKEGGLLKYGIETAEDLAAAKNLILGRQAIGTAVVYASAQKYMSGGLTGNGPADQTMKKLWIDSGWKPRSIKVGDVWVSYDSFEPFNLVLANIADVGDNMQLMGPQFSEDRLGLVVAALGKGATSKTYMQGIGQLFDLLGGEAGFHSTKIVANLANNTVPLAGLRNEIGKVFTPYMRELGSDFSDHIRNRNLITENIATDQLPIKYDMLNGEPIKDWNFMTRAFNAVSPVQLNLDQGPGRKLLFQSGYDLRVAAYSAPDGTNLRDSPKVRSLYQQAIGKQNLEAQLNELAARPDVQASIEQMNKDKREGKFELDPMKAYHHNKLIKRLMRQARLRAWASIKDNSDVKELTGEHRQHKIDTYKKLQETRNLINIPK